MSFGVVVKKLLVYGAVDQLEERVVRNDEVGSSNLLGSTKTFPFAPSFYLQVLEIFL